MGTIGVHYTVESLRPHSRAARPRNGLRTAVARFLPSAPGKETNRHQALEEDLKRELEMFVQLNQAELQDLAPRTAQQDSSVSAAPGAQRRVLEFRYLVTRVVWDSKGPTLYMQSIATRDVQDSLKNSKNAFNA